MENTWSLLQESRSLTLRNSKIIISAHMSKVMKRINIKISNTFDFQSNGKLLFPMRIVMKYDLAKSQSGPTDRLDSRETSSISSANGEQWQCDSIKGHVTSSFLPFRNWWEWCPDCLAVQPWIFLFLDHCYCFSDLKHFSDIFSAHNVKWLIWKTFGPIFSHVFPGLSRLRHNPLILFYVSVITNGLPLWVLRIIWWLAQEPHKCWQWCTVVPDMWQHGKMRRLSHTGCLPTWIPGTRTPAKSYLITPLARFLPTLDFLLW